MEKEKTFRDFYNQVIAEDSPTAHQYQAIDQFSHGIGKMLKALTSSQPLRESEIIKFLRIYAAAFVITHESSYNDFISTVLSRKTTPYTITKYQFTQAFFDYYFNTVFHGNVNEILESLEEGGQTISIEKRAKNKKVIKQLIKVIEKGQKHQSVIVETFDALMREEEVRDLINHTLGAGNLVIRGVRGARTTSSIPPSPFNFNTCIHRYNTDAAWADRFNVSFYEAVYNNIIARRSSSSTTVPYNLTPAQFITVFYMLQSRTRSTPWGNLTQMETEKEAIYDAIMDIKPEGEDMITNICTTGVTFTPARGSRISGATITITTP